MSDREKSTSVCKNVLNVNVLKDNFPVQLLLKESSKRLWE